MRSGNLAGSRILVVEDEYFLADDARFALQEVGADIVGPVPTVAEAGALIENDQQIDLVLLDVNLRGEMAFGLADILQGREIPFAFVTGYDRSVIPERFSGTPSLNKPVDAGQLIEMSEGLAAKFRSAR